MQAIQIQRFGGPEVLELVSCRTRPGANRDPARRRGRRGQSSGHSGAHRALPPRRATTADPGRRGRRHRAGRRRRRHRLRGRTAGGRDGGDQCPGLLRRPRRRPGNAGDRGARRGGPARRRRVADIVALGLVLPASVWPIFKRANPCSSTLRPAESAAPPCGSRSISGRTSSPPPGRRRRSTGSARARSDDVPCSFGGTGMRIDQSVRTQAPVVRWANPRRLRQAYRCRDSRGPCSRTRAPAARGTRDPPRAYRESPRGGAIRPAEIEAEDRAPSLRAFTRKQWVSAKYGDRSTSRSGATKVILAPESVTYPSRRSSSGGRLATSGLPRRVPSRIAISFSDAAPRSQSRVCCTTSKRYARSFRVIEAARRAVLTSSHSADVASPASGWVLH